MLAANEQQAKKDRICEILGNVYKKLAEKDKSSKKPKLGVTYVNQADLKEKVCLHSLVLFSLRFFC